MDKARSLYLEIVRIIAAFYVFIYHFGSEPMEGKVFLSSEKFNPYFHINWFGAHFFVLIFFVLSGFLITMSAHKRGLTFKSFFIARLGRMYSVVIPALVFTYLVAFFLSHLHYRLENYDHLLPRFFLNAFFLTQSWNLCAMPPVDGPFWSISYEFMYYMIMGSILLIPKPYKIISVLFFAFIAGPKVLLLFPAWLAGSLLFYLTRMRYIFKPAISVFIFLVTTFLIIQAILFPSNFPLLKQIGDNEILGYNLFFSWNYQADYLFAALILINFYSFFGFSKVLTQYMEGKGLDKALKVIYSIGNCTFTLYLFHVPLMIFLASVFPYDKLNPWHNAALICITLIIVFIIARKTEWKVNFWRSLISKIIEQVQSFLGKKKLRLWRA